MKSQCRNDFYWSTLCREFLNSLCIFQSQMSIICETFLGGFEFLKFVTICVNIFQSISIEMPLVCKLNSPIVKPNNYDNSFLHLCRDWVQASKTRRAVTSLVAFISFRTIEPINYNNGSENRTSDCDIEGTSLTRELWTLKAGELIERAIVLTTTLGDCPSSRHLNHGQPDDLS